MAMTITQKQLDSVTHEVEGWFDGDVDVRSNYGGRGMYGKTCVGVSGDDNRIPTVFLYFLAAELDMDFLELLDLGMSTDGMGMGSIWYWRGLTVED